MTDWQPMETAPKDGSWFLIYAPCGCDVARWERWMERFERLPTAEYDNDNVEIRNPTHWMPLPEPPNE